MGWLKRLFEEHKFARRSSLYIAWGLIGYATLQVYEPEIMAATNASPQAIYATTVGLMATVIGFYQWSRNKDDKHDPSA